MYYFCCFKKKGPKHTKTVHFENEVTNPLMENDDLSRRTTLDNNTYDIKTTH